MPLGNVRCEIVADDIRRRHPHGAVRWIFHPRTIRLERSPKVGERGRIVIGVTVRIGCSDRAVRIVAVRFGTNDNLV
jgi:hypothetical protein